MTTCWNPIANDSVLSLAVGSDTVYACGQFNWLGGKARNYIAAIDIKTGEVW